MNSGKPDFPSEASFWAAAQVLACEPAAIKAIATVEAGPYGAFLDDGRPIVLFERHKFHQFTDGRFDYEAPDVSNVHSGGYSGSLSGEHVRLARAAQLDREAALKSASWGLFQIMGFNHEAAGFAELQAFVNAMYRSADEHLLALVSFLLHNPRMVTALRELDFQTFADLYNGSDSRRNRYAERITAAYREAVK